LAVEIKKNRDGGESRPCFLEEGLVKTEILSGQLDSWRPNKSEKLNLQQV